jgi:hypothetical protein
MPDATNDGAAQGSIDAPADGPGPGSAPQDASTIDAGLATVVVPDIPHNGTAIYVSPTGKDTNPGTLQAPVLTIVHAAALAGANGDVVFLDGVYDGSTQPLFLIMNSAFNGPLTLSNGITLRAQNAGKAILRGDGGLGLTLLGSNALVGLQFETFSTAVTQKGGGLLATGVTFANCGYGQVGAPAGLFLTQTARARLEPGGVANYVVPPSGTLADVDLDSQLEIRGGAIAGTVNDPRNPKAQQATLVSTDGALLLLNGVTVGPSSQTIGVSVAASQAQLTGGSTISGYDVGVLSSGRVVIDGSSLSGNRLGFTTGLSFNTSVMSELILVNASIHDNRGDGIGTSSSLQIDSAGSQIRNNGGSGIHLSQSATVTLIGTSITGNAAYGLRIEPVSYLSYALKMRSSQVTDNGFFGLDLHVAGYMPPADLGFRDDGNNVFQNNGHSPTPDAGDAGDGTGANVFVAGGWTVNAIGNTWEPNVENADGQGRYHAGDAGPLSYFTGNMPSGSNFLLGPGGEIALARAGQ